MTLSQILGPPIVKRMNQSRIPILPTLLALAFVGVGIRAHGGVLRAGAARLDITPQPDEALPMSGYAARTEGHKSIHDNLYLRAVVLDDGATQAVLISADLIDFSHNFWSKMSQRLAQETGVPSEHILIIATHTHAAPALGTYEAIATNAVRAAYMKKIEDGMIEVSRQAQQRLQPARLGYGSGRANVNVNRRALMADGSWWLGINPDGPSDKTIAILKIETAAGEPIAILINYGVHGTGMGKENLQISGDVPGAASRWVERHFEDKVVAPWISGAGGDQCPIYDRVPTKFDGVMALGRILGEEALQVAKGIKTSPEARISAAQKIVSCAGRKLIGSPGIRQDYEFVDTNSVDIRLSVIRINDLALAGISGEVFTLISQRLKRESRAGHTVVIAHCNGSSGYLPDDAAYDQLSYEVQVSRVRPGCAENAIVNGALELVELTGKTSAARKP